MSKPILDVCCGSRMFWFDKRNPNVVFMDNREIEDTLCDGRKLEVKPDIVGDFRHIPFAEGTFRMAVFDPPHLRYAGDNSWLAKKYGVLPQNWKEYIKGGFNECMRILEPYGTLIFKWNDEQIPCTDVLKAINTRPLFGDRRGKTRWLVFMKLPEGSENDATKRL